MRHLFALDGAGPRAGAVWVAGCLVLGLAACRERGGPGRFLDSGRAGDPAGWFTDATARSGVTFVHRAGTNFFMPDQVGAGVAVLDYDRDGRLDLYFVQNGGRGSGLKNELFRQRPDGTFENASSGSGLDVEGWGMGAIAGDANDDGWPDVVVTEYGGTRVFQNLGGGRFEEVTGRCGVDNPRWAVPASFLDYDRDGRLDLVVGNYLDYDPTQLCHDVRGDRDFCAPQAFPGTATRLWRNVTPSAGGPLRFEEVTAQAGLSGFPGAAMGIVGADFTGDGWPDIFCADDGRPSRLFINQRTGRFTEEAVPRGVALNAMGRTAANMGVAYADVDADGRGDLFVTHLSEEFHGLYRQDQPGIFSDWIAQSGLQRQGWRGTGFGTVAADFDLDGDLDLAFVNGLVRRAIPGQTPVLGGVSPWWAVYGQRAQLFSNEGGGRFVDISEANRGFCGEAQVGRSLALADLDGDGAPDLVTSGVGGPARVYRNTGAGRGHWLTLRLRDPARGGRDAIGAEAVVQSGQQRWWAVLQPATSFLSSHEAALHFGLGAAGMLDGIEVRWPDGARERFPGGAADRVLDLNKGAGQ